MDGRSRTEDRSKTGFRIVHLLRLIRLPNILIILITQALLYFVFLLPVFRLNGIESEMGTGGFWMMYLITAIITISGYLINDIVDLPIDSINKKEKLVIGKLISIMEAKWIYGALILLGFVLSFMYAFSHDVLKLLFIYPLACALLAFYSSHLKGMAFLGNLTVSAFSALVSGIILLFEEKALKSIAQINPTHFDYLMLIFIGFIAFGFLSSFYREIIKDMEDIEGDRLHRKKTGAVLLGIPKTRYVAISVGILFLLSLILWVNLEFNFNKPLMIGVGSLIVVIIFYSIYKLLLAKAKTDFHNLSQLIKVIMFLGLIYLALYSFYLPKI